MSHVSLPKKMNQKKTPSIMGEMEGKFVEMFGDGDGTRAGNGTGNGTFVQSVLTDGKGDADGKGDVRAERA